MCASYCSTTLERYDGIRVPIPGMKKNNPINRMFKQLVRFVRRGRSGEVFSLAEEWAYYTENVGRFPLPDARKKFVLIKGAQSAGYFDTFN